MSPEKARSVIRGFVARIAAKLRAPEAVTIEFSADPFIRILRDKSTATASPAGSNGLDSGQQLQRERRGKTMAGTRTFAELDVTKIQNAINGILAERNVEGAFVWKLFPDFCIYKVPAEEKLYKASYSVSGIKVTLSEKPIEVTEQTEFVPVKGVQFNESPGLVLDQDSVKFSEAARQRSSEKKISLGEAMYELRSEGWKPDGPAVVKFNAAPGIVLDQDSVEVCKSALKISADQKITFGEALSELKH